MAEFVFKKMLEEKGLLSQFVVESRGTSAMVGSRVHHGTARILDTLHIDYSKKRSIQLTQVDGEDYDYLIGMDKRNIQDTKRIVGSKNEHKVHSLMSYTGIRRDIADPWYTGKFDLTYKDICEGLEAFFDSL